MYKIIGIDGRQYGPVSQEEIKSWIAAGRANAETRAQAEGATDWKPLSEFSEFAEALAAKAGSSKASTSAPGNEAPGEGTRPTDGEAQQALLRIGGRETKDAGSCLGGGLERVIKR